MEAIFTAEGLVSFLTLLALEIVLGIDNVIFIAILAAKLPEEQQPQTRQLGIAIAVISRLVLIGVLFFLVNGEGFERDFLFNRLSVRDLVLILGGAFLIGKSTFEIHEKLDGDEHGHGGKAAATMRAVLIQVFIMDVVFSLDSVLTALGVAESLTIMVVAILISAAMMVFFANSIAEFVERNPTFKILALAFLILIGSVLLMEGWNEDLAHQLHVKNYVYFAMAFSVIIELLNMRLRNITNPVHLKRSHLPAEGESGSASTH